MSNNPFVNAGLAASYISIVASVMYYGPKLAGPIEDSVIVPIAFLSLFVLSAAVMGFFFVLEPLRLFLDGHREEAIAFFLKTVGVFALVTVFFLSSLLFISS